MKKRMSLIGTVAILLIALMSLGNLLKTTKSHREMQGVEQYMAQRYPGMTFTYSTAQRGGRGAYSIVRPADAPEDSFRVFSVDGGSTYDDTYYTITLREDARTQAQQLVRKVFPNACVLAKVYQLVEGETLPPYPTLDAYRAKKGANIDLRIIVDASESASFTQANIEKALTELSSHFYSELVVFSLAKDGKFSEASSLTYAKAESQAKQWSAQDIKARIKEGGVWELR